MQAETQVKLPVRMRTLIASAAMLERLERNPRSASAEQYRGVVQQLSGLLAAASGDPALPTFLSAFPAAGEIYENLQFASAGLCRSPLPAMVDAEIGTQKLIERLRKG